MATNETTGVGEGLVYSPLPHPRSFRLLRVLPGRYSDGIRCELVPCLIDSACGTYEAASYTWGSPLDPPIILCNDSPLKIQQNAFAMLRALRPPEEGEPRLLWVDAICINQQDNAEKEVQVVLMGDIYTYARAVAIWLGEEDESSRVAMQYASTLDCSVLREEFDAQDLLYVPVVERASARQKKTFFFDQLDEVTITSHKRAELEQLAIHILQFLLRPYFGRVWVQQEVRLAGAIQVHIGASVYRWDRVWPLFWIMMPRSPGCYPDFANTFYDRLSSNLGGLYCMEQFRKRSRNTEQQFTSVRDSFATQVETYRELGATDPRDKIYALLNLTHDGHLWIGSVDYSVPWQLLYLKIAKMGLLMGIMEGLLQSAGRARQDRSVAAVAVAAAAASDTDTDIMAPPSWMPDLRQQRITDYMIQKSARWRQHGSEPKNFALFPAAGASKSQYCAINMLPKRLRAVIRGKTSAVPKTIQDYTGDQAVKALWWSYVTFNCYMMDDITYIGNHYDSALGERSPGLAMVEAAERDLAYVRETYQSIDGEPVPYISGETCEDAFKLTCMLGLTGSTDDWEPGSRDASAALREGRSIRSGWDEWIAWLRLLDAVQETTNGTTDQRGAATKKTAQSLNHPKLFDAATSSQYPHHYRFAITRSGFFCLVPGIARVGDSVATVEGYGMPLVVRPYQMNTGTNTPPDAAKPQSKGQQQNQQQFHEFLGDTYVHGAMIGELWSITGVFTCRHNPTQAQRKKLQDELDNHDYDGWKMLDFSSGYAKVIGTIGKRELHIV